ncbi:caffeic acid 3-O-methyltransferase 2-like [Cryptomeria japonica]|uniref:caffeic acid 3-O-methyltransferase 2-like n=1 Tax=Cryptomeria japonica TaxID=3369 RepID=UPI0025AD2EA0|nr:caffeic acid 3-O-methyltransferase 2-like [Cryptomeria japonica]
MGGHSPNTSSPQQTPQSIRRSPLNFTLIYGMEGVTSTCCSKRQMIYHFAYMSAKAVATGWLHLHESVLEGSSAFSKAFGMSYWEYVANNPEANKTLNEAMSCDTRAVMSSVVKIYEDGFKKINSLVDVGGGLGSALSIIVDNYKHITGTNFDLPYVIASALLIAGKLDLGPLIL